jgi:hypothetical protein
MTSRSFRPTGATPYRVRDNDSWEVIARRLGVAPWTLIRFNYPGISPDMLIAAKEVNWYLQEFVGCKVLTSDDRNYKFSNTAAPGYIYIPVAGAVPTVDETARKEVLDALRSPTARRMNFGLGRFFISAGSYEQVADAIDRGFIHVKVQSSFHNRAEYHPDINEIWLAPGTSQSLIIHECTHAIFDLRKYTSAVEESEGIAYVAQELFDELKSGPRGRYIVSSDPADPVSWVAWQSIFDMATALAKRIAAGDPWIMTKDAQFFYWAIKNANFYRSRVGATESGDGIGADF